MSSPFSRRWRPHSAGSTLSSPTPESAGIRGIFELGEEDWATILKVNLIGSFLAVKHGAQAMLKRKRAGAIVCTASIAGLRAGAGGPAYSASKAGVINLVQSAAQQLSGSGI